MVKKNGRGRNRMVQASRSVGKNLRKGEVKSMLGELDHTGRNLQTERRDDTISIFKAH